MKGVYVILMLGTVLGWGSAVFLNNRPFPTYSLEDMPRTQFSCREKILGGYYADPEAQCQMFHICVKVAGVGVQDFRFLCPNGTAFDQDHQICAEWEDVDCDATTLYYSSDNFDLYRVGSGFESKALKYGEDEDVFALQRAETGDIRLNRDHQVQSVNQQKDPYQRPAKKINFNNNYNANSNARNNYNNNNFNNNKNSNNNNRNDEEKEIFQKSSSSNFFNNRNNGKENDEDYDDNVNVNQNRDFEQKRKIVRKQQRRPAQQQQNYNRQETTTPSTTAAPIVQQTRRPHQRPTGFVNNFAGSYAPTTKAPITPAEQPTTANNNLNTNFRRAGNNVQRRPTSIPPNNNNNNFQQTNNQNYNSPSPSYTISTPAPFSRVQNTQPQSFTNNKPTTFNGNQFSNNQYQSSTVKPSSENYQSTQSLNYNSNYDFSKPTKQHSTENYPSNNPQYSKTTNSNYNTPSYTAFDKKPTGINYKPTTFSPKAKPFSASQNTQNVNNAFPTTFSPRTNQAYNQVAQQTNSNQNTNFNNNNQNAFTTTTQKPTTALLTQYTPTVPKISSTTPINKPVNKYDHSQYDDGSYDSRYDYSDNKDDEFLKTAHSQNIANSRNEYEKSLKQSTTQTSRGFSTSTENYPKQFPTQVNRNNNNNNNQVQNNYNSRPTTQRQNVGFQQQNNYTPPPQRITQNTQPQYNNSPSPQRTTQNTQQQYNNSPSPQRNAQNAQQQNKPSSVAPQGPKKSLKKPKDYDYAYYDSALPDVDEYQIDTDIQKERRN